MQKSDLSDMQGGLGIGCTIAILLMIVSLVCFINAVYEYLTDEPLIPILSRLQQREERRPPAASSLPNPPAPWSLPRPSVPWSPPNPPAPWSLPNPPAPWSLPNPPAPWSPPNPPAPWSPPNPPAPWSPPNPPAPWSPPNLTTPCASPLPDNPSSIIPVKQIGHSKPFAQDHTVVEVLRIDYPSYDNYGASRIAYGGTNRLPKVDTTGSFIRTPEPQRRDPYAPNKTNCMLSVCQEYFQSLELNAYFETESDCYCPMHSGSRRPDTAVKGGFQYTVPHGWVRFRIKMNESNPQSKNLFTRWTTSYYGTCEEKLKQIIRNRLMPMPGDKLTDCQVFSDNSGLSGEWLTSPSINYASNARFSPMKEFMRVDGSNQRYNVQVVLQCKQEPGTFECGAGTPKLCNIIPANTIEWKSKRRSTLVPNGLMIRAIRK